ncbi:MAG: hypothetical protein ACTHKN_02480, partial [Achromobacter mucicolens]
TPPARSAHRDDAPLAECRLPPRRATYEACGKTRLVLSRALRPESGFFTTPPAIWRNASRLRQ